MKSYYCKRLYEEINFDAESIYVCCGKSLGPSYPIYKNSKDNLLKYIKNLLKWRYNCSKQAYLGKISNECKNCIELKEQNITFFDFIKSLVFNLKKFPIQNIIIKSFRQCELNCAYCLEKKYTRGHKIKEIVRSDFYDIFPIFCELKRNKLLSNKDLRIEFQGESISVWDEFQKVLDICIKTNVKQLLYHTNAYTYIPEISEAAKKVESFMSISIDSGCQETYKLIKGEDCFNRVIENIKKYAQAGIGISCKYIIVKNINDNLEEIKKFCEVVNNINSNLADKNKLGIMLDIDFRDSLTDTNYAVPKEYLELFKYVYDFSNKHNINFGLQDFIKEKLSDYI